jgi:cytochrome c-type biogenesis protein CcmE
VSKLRYRWFVLPSLAVIGLVVAFLVFGLSDNLVYYQTPTEAIAKRAQFPDGDRFRLGGQVETGSLEETDDGATFVLTDGTAEIRVVHSGTPPQLFQEGIGAIVEGAWEGDHFESNTLIVKHDEEYRAPTANSE